MTKRRLMSTSAFPHAVFLERPGNDELPDELIHPTTRCGQGAFLTLRVVDLLAGPWRENAQAFEYQRSATHRYVTEQLHQEHPEIMRLRSILEASSADRPREPLLASLLDYADYLEIVGTLTESADVLRTLLQVGMASTSPETWIEGLTRASRTLIALGRLDEASYLHRKAKTALHGVKDSATRIRSRLAGLELRVAGGDVTRTARAALRLHLDARRSKSPGLDWVVRIGIARALLTARRPSEAALGLGHAADVDQAAPPRVLLDIVAAFLDVGYVSAASQVLKWLPPASVTETLGLRARRLGLEINARLGDQLGFARAARELRDLIDPAVVATLRQLSRDPG